MEIPLAILFLAGLCAVLYYPALTNPYSEDDGQWLYNSLLNHRTKTNEHDKHRSPGYFGIPWLFSKLLTPLNTPGPGAVNVIKGIWYFFTACTVFWLTLLIWQSPLTATMAAALFIITTALPSTLFFFTYGEHFFLLPINLCLIFSLLGCQTEAVSLFLLQDFSPRGPIKSR